MSVYSKKEDLRIIKTKKLLLTALPKLLERRNFAQITVNDLCEEAQLSRTAFYAHFQDKYDLLRVWLNSLKAQMDCKGLSYGQAEKIINEFIAGNTKIIKNLVKEANPETMELLHDFAASLLNIPGGKETGGKSGGKYNVLSTFCAGGMVNLLSWQIKNDFPENLQLVNGYFSDILGMLQNFASSSR